VGQNILNVVQLEQRALGRGSFQNIAPPQRLKRFDYTWLIYSIDLVLLYPVCRAYNCKSEGLTVSQTNISINQFAARFGRDRRSSGDSGGMHE
jgi:hypothetical protein